MVKRKRWVRFVCILVSVLLLTAAGAQIYIRAAYPLSYADIILQTSDTYGVSPSLIAAVICTESRFRPQVVSHAGAVGLMQLTPETFRWVQAREGVKEPLDADALNDPKVNIQYGTATLKLLFQMFEDETVVLAAYNAGQGTVKKWLADPQYSADGVHLDTIPYAETAQYVKRVKTGQTIYNKIYHLS